MGDNDQSAGAMPAAGGATPPQTPPAQPAATPPTDSSPPATGDDEQLKAPGIRALEAERTARREADEARKTAEKELSDLKAQNLTDTERAIAEAKTAGAAEVTDRFHGQIRRSEIKVALSAAGINASVLDLAAKADEFAKLKVNDEGEVEGLDEAVKAFKKGRADLFGKPSSDGTADGGAQGDGAPRAKSLDDAIEAHYAKHP